LDAVVGKPRLAEVDGGAAGREPIEVGEFVLGRGEALPEFDPKGGIPSPVVADFRRIVASTWASLSLTPV
jgi:hypothetical protein